MEKMDAGQPISITLDGSNYILWAQAMTSFLKGKKLWRIITGDVIKPVKAPEENQSKYEERLEDWDSKNHQSDCWKNPNKQSNVSNSRGQSRNTYSQGSQSKSNYQYKSNIASRPAAAATEDSDSPDSTPTPQFSMTDAEAIIQQVLAKSGTPNDSSSLAPPEVSVLIDDHAPRLVEPTESPQPSTSSPTETTTCSPDTSCSSEPPPLLSKRY
ncbi:hypothetical protein RHSIM_Rhsim12G0018900 [Rhododendron simsii]|uniref:Retrotransposon Copia-like N-terminal domain-containing protein n=1 Tax=Rhododendron simsii TaxID=118357 RepID=A0A834L8F5_RHOSS|nr:hypothetical protein RHSIM_Rhsim12G0018900 [Rhododendron simsii]